MLTTISQYVLKVHSRCDLSCDHCYVYQHADQSWRAKPKTLADVTAGRAASRIAEHAQRHQLDEVHVVLHGGEPLLLGPGELHKLLDKLRSCISPVTQLDLRIHTNGVRLDEEICELFASYDVKVGVSLDGDRAANDRHRKFSDGRSSHQQVQRALALLRKPEYRHLYAGILCTVDLNNDPVAVYQALLAEDPPCLDLLLPHATWDRPPYRPAGIRTPYAAWLELIYDRWIADGRPMPIRFFDSLQSAWAGQRSWTEAAGLDPVDFLVIETDGSWEQADSLKTAFEGASTIGMNVFSHSVDQAAAHPGIAARHAGIATLCESCRTCPVVRACGGGLYAHRYKSGSGFSNPSVYCEDLKSLIPRVTAGREKVNAPVPQPGHRGHSHSVPPGTFEALAAGPGDTTAMASLLEAQWSVNRALVAAVAARLGRRGTDLAAVATNGWALLCDLDAEKPEAVREVLTHPLVRTWATRCLRSPPGASFDLDGAHLAGLAAAAALRAGMDTELVLAIRHGAMFLPGFGARTVAEDMKGMSSLRTSPPTLWAGHAARQWLAVRQVTAAGMTIAVEDVDPFRDSFSWPVAGRLPRATWQAWQGSLPAAMRELAGRLPAYAEVIKAGLRCVVPLRPDPAGASRSSTAREVSSGLALALPDETSTLSVLLLHEMQHVKLAALSELCDLFGGSADRLRVPWRSDPRPVEGVLHGTYAHLAIAELWRARAQDSLDEQAHERFLMYGSWVREAIGTLSGEGHLTADGARFVDGMRSTVEAWGNVR